jgi:ABC-type methionine transport system permease subunit
MIPLITPGLLSYTTRVAVMMMTRRARMILARMLAISLIRIAAGLIRAKQARGRTVAYLACSILSSSTFICCSVTCSSRKRRVS